MTSDVARRTREVFVTSHGRRYHDPARHLMTGSGKALASIRAAEREGYEPCSYCFGTAPARPAIGRDPSAPYLRLTRAQDQHT